MADRNALGAYDLSVPFLFVRSGQAPPPEWLAQHPGWVKFPARLVPHGTRPEPLQPLAGQDADPRLPQNRGDPAQGAK